ncbi:kinase-like protein [Zopfia rhizophila CBS 207.26]|uniref:Kinase-like protein n=1 Tax=Zopfia rhizophila CBS 207.26 TaxID=1314779 RepID=A0A6A6ESD7_9PEZI|nr:kinase-like protein [Zopfia rhizophila CBS 207.26]
MEASYGVQPNTTPVCCDIVSPSLLQALPTNALNNRDPTNIQTETEWSNSLQFLAAGKSGIVYGIDEERVLKEYYESDSGEVERQVYQRLGSHPHVAELLGTLTNGSIILERGDCLRTICRDSAAASEIPIQRKLGWLRQAAEGYQILHARDIIHGDVGCNNLILTRRGVKLIDFEGCSIDGGPADSCYEWFSYCPSVPSVSQRTDIFAFGCVIHEVLTGKPPYHELEASDDRYKKVGELYMNNHFPDVATLPLGQLIQSCWSGELKSMREVIQELEAFRTSPFNEGNIMS